MNSELPLVVKAQPLWNAGAKGKKKGYGCFLIRDLERERLGWEEREKALAKKLEKIAKKAGKVLDMVESVVACCDQKDATHEKTLFEVQYEISEIKGELLGLSK